MRHPIRFRREHRFAQAHAFDFLDGELDQPSAERVQKHARLCPKCREALDALRRTISGLHGLQRPVDTIVPDILRALTVERRAGEP